jgi:hypothetical protein
VRLETEKMNICTSSIASIWSTFWRHHRIKDEANYSERIIWGAECGSFASFSSFSWPQPTPKTRSNLHFCFFFFRLSFELIQEDDFEDACHLKVASFASKIQSGIQKWVFFVRLMSINCWAWFDHIWAFQNRPKSLEVEWKYSHLLWKAI